MTKNSIWCGFLEAGDKGSPVVRDDELDTGNPAKVYLFNLKRNEIIAYNRAIAEPKLRELTEKEAEQIEEALRMAYQRARRQFRGRAERPAEAAEAAASSGPPPEPALRDEDWDGLDESDEFEPVLDDDDEDWDGEDDD